MTTIAIVRSAGNYTADKVLGGIFGTATPSGKPDTVLFRPDPSVARVSPHLFAQMPQLPVRTDGLELREVPDAEADLVRAQMLFALGARWAGMYSQRIGDTAEGLSMEGLLLSGEANTVATGVRESLQQMGMTLYEVPVKVTGKVLDHGSYVRSVEAMTAGMTPSTRVVQMDLERAVRPLLAQAMTGRKDELREAIAEPAAAPAQTEAGPARRWVNNLLGAMGLGETQVAPAPITEQGEPQTEQGPDWSTFQGIEATIEAKAYLVANSEEALQRALAIALEPGGAVGGGLFLIPERVVAVQDMQDPRFSLAEADFDEDGEDYNEGDRP